MASITSTVGPNGQYSRDSFDRFGDDLSELILSYLSIREKRSLEGVAKQWQRLIYNKILELHFHRPDLVLNDNHEVVGEKADPKDIDKFMISLCKGSLYNSRRLEALLKKYTNIRKLVFKYNQIDDQLVSVIEEYCPNLDSISLIWSHMTRDTLQHFGRVLGPKIKVMDSTRFCISCEFRSGSAQTELFALCPNIETLVCRELSLLANKDKQFLPKLQSLDTDIYQSDYKLIPEFVAKYGTQLVSLKLMAKGYPITNFEGIFWKDLIGFKSLEKLNLVNQSANVNQSIADMGLKPNLKYLSINSYQMSEQMFENISQSVPNLQVFELRTNSEFSDNLLKSLSGLSSLRKIKLSRHSCPLKNITDNGVIQLLDNCSQLNKIQIESSGIQITTETVTKLISIARKRHKRLIQFNAGAEVVGRKVRVTSNKFVCDDIPKNLKLLFGGSRICFKC